MKQIVKNFNNLVKKTIFKVKNKTNNNFKISIFNKCLITFIALLFVYLFYLLTPLLYEKSWVKTNIKSKLLNEFKINLNSSSEALYRILPSPHFLIKDSEIFIDELGNKKALAEIKNLKVFINQKNFFSKKNMNIKKIIINQGNFTLLKDDLILLNKFENNYLSNKKIYIDNSNIFFKDNLNEIISIVKIDKANLFFDNKKLLNLLNLKGEVFKIPFVFNFEKQIDLPKNKLINIDAKNLRLNILNESSRTKQNFIHGKNVISFMNSKINTEYKIKDKIITFTSNNSKINNSHVDYKGKLSIHPFDVDLNIDIYNYKISKLLNTNPILNEFIKSGLVFNDNISLNGYLAIQSNSKKETFQNAKINFLIKNGKINFNKTILTSDNFGSLELLNSNLFLKKKKLIFNSDVLLNIKNNNRLFSFLNTKKSLRKNFKKILINLEYDLLNDQIKFYNIKIDNKDVSEQLLPVIENFIGNNLNNPYGNRRLINELLKVYEG